MLYRETESDWRKITYILKDKLTLFEMSELEHLVFEVYNRGYLTGMEEAYSDYDSNLLEMIGVKQKV